MFENGFPEKLYADAHYVSNMILLQTNVKYGQEKDVCQYMLIDGQKITFPYRIYYHDIFDNLSPKFSPVQKTIYHCIFSRNCDGFVREKHIKELISFELPEWAIPYIVKVCDEYVVEILECVYNQLDTKYINTIKLFCLKNVDTFCRSYDKMISYWNEFYRVQCFCYKDYIGKRLFTECFGYSRSLKRKNKEV